VKTLLRVEINGDLFGVFARIFGHILCFFSILMPQQLLYFFTNKKTPKFKQQDGNNSFPSHFSSHLKINPTYKTNLNIFKINTLEQDTLV
jgi:hypothetical protein